MKEMNMSIRLQEITEEKDLGVYTSSDLKPSLQCGRVASSAM